MFGWFTSLRVRFMLLVLVSLLPALALLFYVASRQRDQAVEDAREDAQRLAALVVADQERLLEGTRLLLVVLARLPEARTDDPAACGALLADVRANFPVYANLGVIGPDGVLRCSALPTPEETYLGDRLYFRRAVETGDFAVGEHQFGRVSEVASLNCAYPILDESGRLLGVVYAALSLDWLNEFTAGARLPEGTVLTVIDRNGTVLVHRPDPDESWIGRQLTGTPVVDTILIERTGVTEAPGEDGGTHLYAFAPLSGGAADAAFVSVAIPRSVAVAPAERAFSESLTRLGLVATFVLVAAWVGADMLVRRDVEANKALVHRLYDSYTTGGVDLLDDVVSQEFVDHDPLPGQAPGLPGMKQAVGLFRAAFPDGELRVEELIAEGDKVVARVRLSGTLAGAFAGAEPTGQTMVAEGVETYRVAGGKIVEGWSRLGPLAPALGGADEQDRPEALPEVEAHIA